MNWLFYLGESLYRRNFPLYYRLYSFYKRVKEKPEIKLIKKIIRHGDVVMDIGANIGFYSTYLSKLTETSGTVHCFEPDDLNFKYLKEVTGGLQNIRLNHKAITDSELPLKLYKSHRLNVDHRTYPVDEFETAYEVAATSIDKYVNGKYKVDFIKMDIQGAEYPALKGMTETLKANPEIVILMEVWPSAFKEFGVSVGTVFDFIHSLGFHMFDFNLQQLSVEHLVKYKGYAKDQFDNVIIAKQIPQHLK